MRMQIRSNWKSLNIFMLSMPYHKSVKREIPKISFIVTASISNLTKLSENVTFVSQINTIMLSVEFNVRRYIF